MGRKRRTDKHLPERMYLKSGSYYFVDYSNKWHNLGRVYIDALSEYGRHRDPDKHCRTIGDLLDRYLLEEAPKKAETTYKSYVIFSTRIRAAFGHIAVDQIKPIMVRQYLDARRKTPASANREIALLSSMYSFAFDARVNRNPKPLQGHKTIQRKGARSLYRRLGIPGLSRIRGTASCCLHGL